MAGGSQKPIFATNDPCTITLYSNGTDVTCEMLCLNEGQFK